MCFVKISVKIDKSGESSEFEIYESSGYELFDEAALEAVKQWKFKAAKRDNQDVNVRILIPIRFELE